MDDVQSYFDCVYLKNCYIQSSLSILKETWLGLFFGCGSAYDSQCISACLKKNWVIIRF